MKRANGTGSITRLSGHRRRPYIVRVPGRDRFGHVVQNPLGYYATAREAQAALDDYNQRSAQNRAPSADSLSVTVAQIYEAWSARAYQRLNPASVQSHKATWNKRVSRYASCKIREMTLDEWQQLLDAEAASGRSQSTINNTVILIRALYAYSMERDIVGKDYSQYLDIPTVGIKQEKGAFHDLQMKHLEELAASGFPWADTALMLCYTGFRVSEFLSLTRFAYHPEAEGYLQGGMKSFAGKDRIIPIHPKIQPYLQARLAQNEDTIIAWKGKPVSAEWYRQNAFHPIAEALGVPVATPHWCRHTFATMLHKANADPLTVKWLMGHSTKSDITAHYTHETIDTLRDGILRMA